ncbi:MAG: autotransporter domain-containing protein [Rhizobiales bacterium]|nr:autotransporter domain-containing protein [Hyphomicrobiales bacterium]
MGAGATYVADITASGAQDLIAVGGVADISGSQLQIVAAPGIYLPGQAYPLLVAAGGIEGEFAAVTTNFTSAFLDATVSYGADGLALDISRNRRAFVEVAVTRNQQEVAAAVEALGVRNDIHDAVLQLSAARAQSAFDLLSGEIYGSAATVMQQQSIYVREAVSARLRQADGAPAGQPLAYAAGAPVTAALAPGLTPVLWAQGYGGWGDSYGNGNAATVSNSLGGFLIGADVGLGGETRVGLFAGFSQSQFDVAPRASSGSMDNYDLGLYAGTRFGAFALRGGASYSWHDVSTARTVSFNYFGGTASADYTSGTAQVFGEVALDLAAGAFAVSPFAGLAYVNVGSASFLESGGAAALSVDTGAMGTAYSTLGVRAATSVQVMGRALTPSVTLGWQHAFGDTTPAATMRFADGTLPFAISGVPIAEDALLLEAGLAYSLSGVAALSVAYSGQIASEATQNALTAQFSLKF